MSDRNRQALHALAWSLPDMQPSPTMSRSYDIRGEAPDTWQRCPDCDGNGQTHDRYRHPTTCPTCSGAGRYRIDNMTQTRVAATDSPSPTRTRRTPCDRCSGTGTIPTTWIERQTERRKTRNPRVAHPVGGLGVPARTGMVRCPACDGDGKVSVPLNTTAGPAPIAVDEGSGLARLRAQGDWDKLEHALGELKTLDPAGHRAWVTARVGGTPPAHDQATTPTPLQREVSRAVSNAEAWLLRGHPWRCPGAVLVAFEAASRRSAAVEEARVARVSRGGRRDGRIRDLVRSGKSIGEVAAACGVSPRTVSRVLAGAS